jgi:uncharacterized protein YjbI with pentapeptide repeats
VATPAIAALQAPDLPELTPVVPTVGESGDLELSGARVSASGAAVAARRVRVRESELEGLALEAGSAPGLSLIDVVLRACNLSNLDAREGLLTRVAMHGSQLVGFGLTRGEVRDLHATDCSLQLASFASATLHNVVFERVNLAEASFMDARLEAVAFVDCRLDGTDFRRATVSGCAIRGTSLDGVLGVDSLRGVRMPWADVVGSAGALAAALGIVVEHD